MRAKKRAKPVKFGKPSEKTSSSRHGGKRVKPLSRRDPVASQNATLEETLTEEIPTRETPDALESQQSLSKPKSDNGQEKEEEQLPESDNLAPKQTDNGESEETISVNINQTSFTKIDESSDRKKNIFLDFLAVAFVSFLIGLLSMAGASFLFKDMNLNFTGSSKISVSIPPAREKPTASEKHPSKAVELSAFTIKVLNGSTTSGEAAKLQKKLVDAGFKVGSIGNADRSDYNKTQVLVKKKVDSAYMNKLKDVLKKTYMLEPDSQLPSSASEEADVVITIGSDLAK